LAEEFVFHLFADIACSHQGSSLLEGRFVLYGRRKRRWWS